MSPTLLHGTVTHRRWAVWLAVLVLVFGTLAPPVSHALAQRDSGVGTQVCSSSPTHFLPADSPAGSQSVVPLAHCPFCLLHTDSEAPPPHVLPYLFSVQDGHQGPTVWQAFFFIIPVVLAPAPRGPPAFD